MAETAGAPRPSLSNGFSPELVSGFVDRIETLYGDLLSEKSEYMLKAKAIRADMALVFDEAKDKDIPKKALKAVIKARDLEAKAIAARDDLEDDLQDSFDNIRHALGDLADLPLGEAALETASELDAARAKRKRKAADVKMPETAAEPAGTAGG